MTKVIVPVFVLGCASAPTPEVSKSRPAWVDGKIEAPYPTALFITGFGIAASKGDEAQAQQRADAQARAEVAKQIRVRIAQEMMDVQREERGADPLPLSSEFTEVVNTSSVDLTLEGVQIRSRWIDSSRETHYSLAVLDREEAASRLANSMDLSVQRGLEWEVLSEQYASQESIVLELKALTQSLAFFWKALQEYQIYRVVHPEGPSLKEPQEIPVTTRLEFRLLERASQIRLEVIGGDQQQGEVGHPLDKKLHVRATWKENPLEGLPLFFSFGTGVGEIDETVLTDPLGEAEAQVHRVGPSGKSQNTIDVRVFSGGLLDREEWGEDFIRSLKSLNVSSTSFTYSLLTTKSIRVGVWIDQPDIPKLKVSLLGEDVARELAHAGYRLIDRSVVANLVKGVDPETLLSATSGERLKGTLDILVIGVVEVTSTEMIQPGFVFARAHGTMRGLRIDRGTELFLVEGEEKGAGRDADQAKIAAIEALGEKLPKEVVEALEKAL
ncbi:MAG: LPP20 family lipoprotein [Deltaproteobacteria bacterium]|nr:LPP20 family lipoprotein [Deltaproteobacteria bacterium]